MLKALRRVAAAAAVGVAVGEDVAVETVVVGAAVEVVGAAVGGARQTPPCPPSCWIGSSSL
jgi:hypothetical protein